MEWMLMPLKRYAEFSGRSRRMEFWMWFVFLFLIGFAFFILMFVLAGGALIASAGDPTQMFAVGGVVVVLYLLYLLVTLALFVPGLAVTVRRLHDTDRSGWWIMLYWGPVLAMIFAPFLLIASPEAATLISSLSLIAWAVGALVLIVFLALEGTKGPNRYGPDPKGVNSGEVFA